VQLSIVLTFYTNPLLRIIMEAFKLQQCIDLSGWWRSMRNDAMFPFLHSSLPLPFMVACLDCSQSPARLILISMVQIY